MVSRKYACGSVFPRGVRPKTEHGRKARGVTMAIEKCIDQFEVDDVIFEEGSSGRELFVVLDGKVDIAKIDGGGKTVIVASARGGVYSTNPALAGLDHQESYLKTVFGFFGITDLRFVRAEGIAMGDAAKAQGIGAAEVAIASLATAPANQPQAELVA